MTNRDLRKADLRGWRIWYKGVADLQIGKNKFHNARTGRAGQTNKIMDEEKERQKEIDEKLEEFGIDPDDPILNDDEKEELADLL